MATTAAVSPGAGLRRRRRIEDKVRRYMDVEGLWPADGRLAVAVSGGPDSTALLLILLRLAVRRSLEVTVAYFDHQLRGGEAAERERRAVETLAAGAGVELRTGGAAVRALASAGHRSLEDAARRARYAFLADVAHETGCSVVATGHTASDQAETVLMHIVRGSGTGGLGGITPSARWPIGRTAALEVVRPLLCLSRDETVAYCDLAGVTPVADESNASRDFLRNRVRHDVLPYLRRLNPRLDAALVRLSDAARADAAFVQAATREAVSVRGDVVALPRDVLARWPSAPRRQAVRTAIQALVGDVEGFGERHIVALERLALRGRTGDSLSLPQGVTATATPREVELRAGAAAVVEPLPAEPLVLSAPGEGRYGPVLLRAGDAALPDADGAIVVDAAAVGGSAVVRRRRAGDRMQPAGMTGTKKLQDLFVDAGVPRAQRDTVPVFETPRGILAVGALRVAEWARPRDGAPVVVLSWRRD